MSITLDSSSTALIVVDMQKDFLCEDGALYGGDAVKKIISGVRSLLSDALESSLPVVFTQDYHLPDDLEFLVWPPHCIQETEGAEIIDELRGSEDSAYFVRKRKYSAFFGTDLDLHLREKDVKTIMITGVLTNICVLHTAGDGASLGYRIVVPSDCVAALSEYEEGYALHHIEKVFQATVVSASEIQFS